MRLAVRSYLPRRQAVLFLTAIFVPCLVLVFLGLRMIGQERQLEDKRVAEERQRRLDNVKQGLLSRLEAIKQEHGRNSRPPHAPVAFVGIVSDGALRLPWENSSRARRFREWIDHGDFALKLRQADAQELSAHQHEGAARQYRDLISASKEAAQQSVARLALARTLQELGRPQESLNEYGHVLSSPPEVVDENDVPLGLYAVPPLLEAGLARDEIRGWVRTAADPEKPMPPAALYMARGFASRLGDSELESSLTGLVRDREQAEALQHDFSRLNLLQLNREPVWTAYGEPLWLVSVASPAAGADGVVVAVRAADVMKQLGAPPLSLTKAADTGESLGESFPGVRVVMPPIERSKPDMRKAFLITGVVLALAFTILAGYLLWRDVQRDLRLSEMRSQFVSSVSHELKTPLTAIRMFTETLRLDEEVDRETRIDYLDTILHESERLSRLVDNVLDFGKIERGKKAYCFRAVRLNEVVAQAARTAQYPLEQAGFSLEVSSQTDLPPLNADADALQQAILNLLTNAMKYSGDSRRIGLSLDRQNGFARIQVVDHGVGISPEDQRRIFEQFYRAPTAENLHIPGTGLGLTIVEHIAKAHGGDVQVESRQGSGSAFTISLPLETPA
jgi:signal transduction histidine kinase